MFRDYDPSRDLPAVQRIWKECGWVETDEQAAAIEGFLSEGDTLVACMEDIPECCVHSTGGEIRYLDESLKLGAVSAVTTSHIARKTGFARKLTARLLARQASRGMEVSALGMFDQGFYDKVGFGTGSYENWFNFDPATLNLDVPFRPPKRLTLDDHDAVFHAMRHRKRSHGGVVLDSGTVVRSEMIWTEKPFGFGYYDGPDGSLSHFIWGEARGEYGPYRISCRAWQTGEQLLELLAMLKALGDQVHQIRTLDFPDIQLQDLLSLPFRTARLTRKGEFAQGFSTEAYWQVRILDLEACLAKTCLKTPTLRFNLRLSDPVSASLDGDSAWRGIAGDYVITLGETSSAIQGAESGLPVLDASVNAFSRMWFGVREASSLAITDHLSADPALLRALDDTLRLPKPHLGWDF